MNTRSKAFSLVEMLVATAILTVIMAVVLGSNVKIISTIRDAGAAIEKEEDNKKVLQDISRQISCMYRPAEIGVNEQESIESDLVKKKGDANFDVFIFKNRPDNSSECFLQFLATRSLSDQGGAGVRKAAFVYDRHTASLKYVESMWIEHANTATDTHERVLLGDVASITCEYFDGRQWGKRWNFDEQERLPRAVKMSITVVDGSRERSYEIAAGPLCSDRQVKQTTSGKRGIQL